MTTVVRWFCFQQGADFDVAKTLAEHLNDYFSAAVSQLKIVEKWLVGNAQRPKFAPALTMHVPV